MEERQGVLHELFLLIKPLPHGRERGQERGCITSKIFPQLMRTVIDQLSSTFKLLYTVCICTLRLCGEDLQISMCGCPDLNIGKLS